ncbi:MAG TPA: hypothetical protein VHT70_05465 [Candidatus Saccharimonadales bacterium]|jgi:hypothetical protein|nr:hypothetical protein [Candidatus Saccharimonadales bacterium]
MPDDDTTHQSEDDALEPKDDIFNPDVDEERLEEDSDPPSAPANDVPSIPIAPDHPDTDTDLDADDTYNNGTSQAADPNQPEDNDNQAFPLDPPQM